MNIFQELLKEKKLTSYRLAKSIGVSQSTISRILNNETDIDGMSVGVLYRIAKYLNVPMEYLLSNGTLKYENHLDKLHVKYITEIYALNLECSLDTDGDWHQSALNWEHPYIRRSWESILGDYGIEWNDNIPERNSGYYVANHIRACLDLLDAGKFGVAKGMRRDYINNSSYDNEIFTQAFKFRFHPNWREIYTFMHKEYGKRWRIWTNGRLNIGN
ncbi:MAG: helix-turn-helix transcriptional regulator [Clostridia bacterium]|nr:helix-turn-helix transcriptional regulator [Clostridia bacterium]